MKMLTKENSREEIEQMALDLIMNQQNKFTVKTIMLAMRAICDDDIKLEEVAEIVFNAIDYCLSEGNIDIFDQFSYLVDPVKQVAYQKKKDETISI